MIMKRENIFVPRLSTYAVEQLTMMSRKKTKSTIRFSVNKKIPPAVLTSVSKNPSSNGVTIATKTSITAVRTSQFRLNSLSKSNTCAVSNQRLNFVQFDALGSTARSPSALGIPSGSSSGFDHTYSGFSGIFDAFERLALDPLEDSSLSSAPVDSVFSLRNCDALSFFRVWRYLSPACAVPCFCIPWSMCPKDLCLTGRLWRFTGATTSPSSPLVAPLSVADERPLRFLKFGGESSSADASPRPAELRRLRRSRDGGGSSSGSSNEIRPGTDVLPPPPPRGSSPFISRARASPARPLNGPLCSVKGPLDTCVSR